MFTPPRFKLLQQSFFFGLLAIVTLVFLWLIRHLLVSVFWSVALGIICYPLQAFWLKITRQRIGLSATLSLLTIVLLIGVIIIPLVQEIIAQSKQATTYFGEIAKIDRKEILGNIKTVVVATSGWFGLEVAEAQVQAMLQHLEIALLQKAGSLSTWLEQDAWKGAVGVGQSTIQFLTKLVVMGYLLFHILCHGPFLIERLVQVLPLGDSRERFLLTKMATTIRAIVKGTLIIALVQGGIGGVLFWLCGITSPLFWAMLMALLATVPVLGPAIIYLPAGGLLLVYSSVWKGVFLILGGICIGLVDNILRPMLVGKDTAMHDTLVLLSTLGGITTFGATGLVVGPLIAAIFLAMWELFEQDFEQDLKNAG